jgi:hypothetical protein
VVKTKDQRAVPTLQTKRYARKNYPKLSNIINLMGAAAQSHDQAKAVSHKGYYVK